MQLNQAMAHDAQESAARADESAQFLTFTIDDEEYGVDIMVVREVKGWTDTTRLPNTPDYIRGVLNLRGVIIPIFDLRARFGKGMTSATEKHVVIVMAVGSRIIGALVDTVSDILTVSGGDIKPAPDSGNAAEQQFVGGLIAVEDRMVVLLDMNTLLDKDLKIDLGRAEGGRATPVEAAAAAQA